jgi:putative aminopeptidase FrvX
MATPELLRSLVSAPGPSGQESAPGRVWREWSERFATEVGVDRVGSSWARVAATADGPRLIVIGHIDEIGVHVTHIDDEGFVRFSNVGGWDVLVLVGQRVVLQTRNGPVRGVIARKPIHLLEEEERKQVPKLKDLHIDIGARDAEEARSMVRIGDVGVIDSEPIELPNDRFVARSLDNRVGCYVAARAAQLVAEAGGAPGEVIAMAVAQEETSFAGARTAAYHHDPDVAIAVDVTFETRQPGVTLGELSPATFGSGPSISRGTTLHPRVADLLEEAAEAEGIPFTLASHGRSTGTDADAVHLSRSGVPTGLIGVPLRYMHSPAEMVQLDDVEAAARLIAAFARRLDAQEAFER